MRAQLERIAAVLRRIIGAPDYEGYLAHIRSCHPNTIPLSRDAFAREALARRYDQPGSRCC